MEELHKGQKMPISDEAPLLEKKQDKGDLIVQQLLFMAQPFKDTPFSQIASTVVSLILQSLGVLLAIIGGQLYNLLGVALLNYDGNIEVQAGFGLYLAFNLLFYQGFMVPLNDKMAVEFGRAFGQKNYSKVKQVFCQSICTAMLLYSCLTLPVFLNCKHILIWTGVAANTAEKTQIIVSMQCLVGFMVNFLFPAQTLCFSQGAETVFALKNLLSLVIASVCSCIFVIHYKMGLYGWILGKLLYETLNLIVAFTTLIQNGHPETWGLVDFKTLKQGYDDFVRDSLQFAFSSYSQFLGIEAIGFFIYRSDVLVDAAAFVCVLNLGFMAFSIGISVEIMCRTRLNLLIAKGYPQIAKTFFSYYLVAVFIYAALYSGLLMLLTPVLTDLFASSDSELSFSFRQLLKVYYVLVISDVATMTIAVGFKSIRRVLILILFSLSVATALNLLAGYWVTYVLKLRAWHNLLASCVISCSMNVLLIALIMMMDWEKAVAKEITTVKELDTRAFNKTTTFEAEPISSHQ
jgi:Na+-driven multidrug efflux pump